MLPKEVALLLAYLDRAHSVPKNVWRLLDSKVKVRKLSKYLQKLKKGKALDPEDFEEIGQILKKEAKKIEQDTSLRTYEAQLLKDLGLLFRKDSQPAKRRLKKIIKEHGDHQVYNLLADRLKDDKETALDRLDPKQLVTALEATVKALTGKKGLDIPDLETRRRAKEKNPDLYKEFLALRRQLVNKLKLELDKFVRSKGGRAKVEEVYRYFKSLRLPAPLPRGLKGLYVDPAARLWTKDGKMIDGNPPWTAKIEMGKPGSDFVFKATLPNGTTLWYYTTEHKQKSTDAKYSSVLHAIKDIDSYKKRWRSVLKNASGDEQVLAAMVELLYRTQARIGSSPPKNPKKGGYGLSTLLRKHLHFAKDGSVILRYLGKKGVKQRHVIKPKDETSRTVIEVLKRLAEGKKPSDPLFTDSSGKRITAARLNRFITGDLKIPITAHKFRHIIGTQLAEELLLKKARRFRDKKKVMEYFKKALSKIGKQLGHMTGEKVSWTTARDNYIDPTVMLKYFLEVQKVRPPAILEKKFGYRLEEE